MDGSRAFAEFDFGARLSDFRRRQVDEKRRCFRGRPPARAESKPPPPPPPQPMAMAEAGKKKVLIKKKK